MLEILKFILSSIENFLGTVVLMVLVFFGLCCLFHPRK
jgi:hypothetical protein